MIYDATAAKAYLDALELDDPLQGTSERGLAEEIAPVVFTDAPQAIAAGSQLLEFDDSVDPALRSAITNTMLFAQLAATKAVPAGPFEAWYAKYTEVLGVTGWMTVGLEARIESFDAAGLDVHKALIGVLTTALAPEAKMASILLSVLNGVEQMADTTPWITVFEKVSKRQTFNSFQLSYGTMEAGTPVIDLMCFSIDADTSMTQILFFKLGTNKTTLRQFGGKATADRSILLADTGGLATRLAQRRAELVNAIEI